MFTDDEIDIESKRQTRRSLFKAVLFLVWMLSLFTIALPEPWGRTCFVWWLLITGILCIYYSISQRINAQRSLSWPSTTGTVREFTPGRNYFRGKSNYGPDSALLQYEYTVDGRNFVAGEAISPEDDSSILRKDAYLPGATVTVYYDPQKPWISKSVSWGYLTYGNLGVLIIGVVLVVCSLAALISGLS